MGSGFHRWRPDQRMHLPDRPVRIEHPVFFSHPRCGRAILRPLSASGEDLAKQRIGCWTSGALLWTAMCATASPAAHQAAGTEPHWPMEPLSNTQHEAFARALAEGCGSHAQAAIDAGYAPVTAAATARRLVARPEVAARIAALRATAPAPEPPPAPPPDGPLVSGPLPTRETVLRGLSDALVEARGQGNLMAQLRALELMGKELGMFGQRAEARPDNPLACLDAQSLLLLRDLLAEEAGVAA